MWLTVLLSTLLISVNLSKAQTTSLNCPLLGPDFAAPRNLSSSKLVTEAGTSFLRLVNDSTTVSGSDAISVSLFSLDEDGALFEYHNSPANLAASPKSVRTIDTNIIYRVASISKLFTVRTFLIEAGDSYWSQPVTKFVPELAAAIEYGGNGSIEFDEIDNVHWEEVTLGSLASYMAGIARDGIYTPLAHCAATKPKLVHLETLRLWDQILWKLVFQS